MDNEIEKIVDGILAPRTPDMDDMDEALIALSGVQRETILEEWGSTNLLQAIEDIQSVADCIPLLEENKGLAVSRAIRYMETFLETFSSTPISYIPRAFKKGDKDTPVGTSDFEKWFRNNLKENFVGQMVRLGDIERIISSAGYEVVEIRSIIESNGIMMVGEWKCEDRYGMGFSCFAELLDGEGNGILYVDENRISDVMKQIGENSDGEQG